MDEPQSPEPEEILAELNDAGQLARIKSELIAGERLLWAASGGVSLTPTSPYAQVRPGSLILLTGLAGLMLFLGVLGVFGVFSGEVEGEDLVVLVLVTVVFSFVGVGCGLNAASNWKARQARRRIEGSRLYAITDRRVIVWEPTWDATGLGIYSVSIEAVANAYRIEYPDGLGDVRFTTKEEREPDAGICPPMGWGFHRIAEPRRAEELLKRLANNRRSDPSPPQDLA